MDAYTFTVIICGSILGLFIIYLIIRLLRKKNVKVVVQQVAVPVTEVASVTPPIASVIPVIKTPDQQLYEKFMKTYDSGDMKFDSVSYRPGGTMTCEFGIAAGYRYFIAGTDKLWEETMPIDKREMKWGYVRPHMGIDKAKASQYTMKNGTKVDDPVICPFDFHRSQIIDFGNYSYGTLITLFNDEYQFEFSIAHMHPQQNILPWSLEQFKAKKPFGRGWVIGTAGTYGFSSGAHTHTEVKSFDQSCEVFDILLEQIYGDKAYKEYTTAQIIAAYRKQEHFKNAKDKEILADWDGWKKSKKILFANPYKIVKIDVDGKSVKTWYSSYLLFNKL